MTISALASSIVGTSKTAGDLSSLSSNESTFLTLLTTQLKNQDPLAPTDTNTFTQQLVQYSQVEQQIQTNAKLDTMTKLQVSSKIQNALSMVGADVEYGGGSFNYNGGSSIINYNLPANAATNTISIQDASGNTVYTTQGALTAGNNTFTWDGSTTEGTQAPAGTYNVVVAANDTTGASVNPTTSVWGQVTGVQATNTDILLMLQGGGSVSLDNVANVGTSPTANNNTSTSGS